MQIVTGRRGEPHVTSRQMQAVYRSFLGDFALLDIGEKLRAEAYSNDIVRVYDGVVSVQGIYAVIAYNQYDEVYIEPVSVGKKRIDTIVLHYTKDNALDVEDMQLDVVQGEEYTDNPIAPVVPEGGDAWEGTTDIQVAIYDVEVTNFGLTVTPYARMLNLIPTLDSIAERIPETVVTGVKGDSEVLYRDGNVNITKANIGLGNVDNTADTDKPISTATQTALNLKADLTYVDAKISAAYHAGGNLTVAELTSALLIADNMGKVYNMSDSGVTTSDFVEGAGEPIKEGDNVGICNVGTEESPVYKFDLLSGFVDLSAYATTSAVNTGLAGKVDKVDGKGLSTNDYTTTEKTKLAGISEGATQTIANPADTAIETLSKLKVGGVVYDVPQGTTGATNLSELNDVNLSGTAEGDILEYDSTANKWKNSNALQGAKTTTGNPITVTDAAPVNAVNLSMDLEPIQDLHGYDHPWVGGAGKNKLNLNELGYSTTSSFSVDTDNSCHFIAPLSDYNSINRVSVKSIVQSGVNYTISAQQIDSGARIAIEKNNTAILTLKNGVLSDSLNVEYIEADSLELVIFNNLQISQDAYVNGLQIEQGSTATDFEPYSNICPISGRTEEVITQKDNPTNPTVTKTYTIQLGDTVYGGQLDITRGKMVVDKKYKVFNGSEVWYTSESWDNCFYTVWGNDSAYDISVLGHGNKIISNSYKGVAKPITNLNNGEILFNTSDISTIYANICVKNESYSNVSDFTTNLANNPIQIVYELATPYTIQLTPQQIKMLENTNTIYTDYEGDTIHIEYQPDNAIGEAVRAVEESYDPEFAVRPVLKKKAFSGTTDSDGSVTLINASDIPSGHKIIPLQITDMTIDGNAGTYFVEYEPYNSGDAVKGYCYFYMSGSQMFPVGKAITGNFYYYELEV